MRLNHRWTLPRRPRPTLGTSLTLAMASATVISGCGEDEDRVEFAQNIYAPLGEPLPDATAEQLATFELGREVALRRFTQEEGLGPTINVSFCAACHESPVFGGGAPRYRDFHLIAQRLEDGSYLPLGKGAVLTTFGLHGADPRTPMDPGANVVARRNAVPFFGVGLIAELSEKAIMANADPDDRDGDGISGRPNFDRGFVGRFGRKSQTVSIEGFIRGPLFNHLGITSDPLSDAAKAALPVPSVVDDGPGLRQAAAPDEPLFDDDPVPDPELSEDELFALVSFSMLLAAPEPDPETARTARGRGHFEAVGCADCHVPTLEGPRGLVPLYSDLLLHDMGPGLADGVEQGVATGSEFRTQPLWGIVAVRPYLHDGRADTLDEAILWHGGEAQRARDGYAALGEEARGELLAFLASLGGASQVSDGRLPPDAPIPEAGEPGAPMAGVDRERWLAGRALFDRDTRLSEGLGPRFNGDSCRACHFDPVIGGAGPRDVNVVRYGSMDADGAFVTPEGGTIVHRFTVPGTPRPEPMPGHDIFETRQSPSLLGLGRIEQIFEDEILAGEDPDDLDGDGIRGVAHIMPDGQVGRFGWKAQIPSVREFVRDAESAELGVTVPSEAGFVFGVTQDDDEVPDPEMDAASIDLLADYISGLEAPAPRQAVPGGEAAFVAAGCDGCHSPRLEGSEGPVALYSDLLLHQIAADGTAGIADGLATTLLFRTPPLWGLADTAPYLHDGSASTIEAAIEAHDGEAAAARALFETLDADTRATLMAFLAGL